MALFLKFFVRLYQLLLAPVVATFGGCRCRFYPSCSHYALGCLDKYPWPNAVVRIAQRLVRCGPWHPGGIDFP